MKEMLVVEFRNAENKLHYAVIGVKAIKLEEDDVLIETEDGSMSLRLNESPIKEKGLKLHVYYPTEGDIMDLLGNKGMFEHGLQIVDGRLEK
ncbi:MAG: hypothetical protein LBS91_03150 [Clostridiales Family XIII bacterium]|jgi:hypothetical protein|nr:hypothetical protein [Clostridiales Family XIII bacterium]